jgi:hypothetical protein
MARTSKKSSNSNFKWLLVVGAAVAVASFFLYPSLQSNQPKNPSSISDDAAESEPTARHDDVYVHLNVPVSRDDPTQLEVFVFSRSNHLWNSVSEFCVRQHAAHSGHEAWPWPNLQSFFQSVHSEAIKSMGSVLVADAEQAYLRSVHEKKLKQHEIGISDGRKLSIITIWDEPKRGLRKRATRFIKLHGFLPSEPIAHIIESIMLSFSFLTVQQPEGTIQWIASSIPKYLGMISNSSFGSRSSGRKVL